MAELEPGAESVTEEIVALVEQEVEAATDKVDDPLEPIAKELGWTPKDDWRGDEAKWKPAADFIRDTGRINREQSRDLKAVRETLAGINRVTDSLVADKVAERDAYWASKHREAVEAGDVEAAEHAATERGKVRTTAPATTPPETADFIARNASWFQRDPVATARAVELTEILAKQGYSVADQLAEAEKAMRRERPDLFPQAAKPQAGVTAPATRQGSASKAKGVDDLPPEAMAVARDYKDRHGIPLEKFAATYWADKAKEKAK